MATPTLARLSKLELREAWANEAGDFTPWLASEENIALLGDTVGLELEVEALEKDVGPFRAAFLRVETAGQLSDESDWPRQHAWLLEAMRKLQRVSRPHIDKMDQEDDEG